MLKPAIFPLLYSHDAGFFALQRFSERNRCIRAPATVIQPARRGRLIGLDAVVQLDFKTVSASPIVKSRQNALPACLAPAPTADPSTSTYTFPVTDLQASIHC
ncbi:hypothetical protein, partial [Mesorhizobium sp. M4B.F.Ca.ET.049.02.1.2]|uniref:hypothetical protein n=1 Tax=Mesorhizobium sp. M4B.F.Ca.ET.049.02.1.2 TaxID=2496752 RepID=UPI001AECCDEA